MPAETALHPLITAGVPALAGLDDRAFRQLIPEDVPTECMWAVHPELVAPSRLAPLLRRGDREGFVVHDMTDLDEFAPIEAVEVPASPLYRLVDVDRGDDLRNASPVEALAELRARGRSPLTVSEGISWLLTDPSRLEPGHCFMTIASRTTTARGTVDARVPALWISGGTGRDGAARRGAPKVGWCWAYNRHTWLGFASVAERVGSATSAQRTVTPSAP
ncbi:DUF5701 family protein [Brachybacterium sp. AOP25-B2-12]|uniref:DUF5701 family protein n=1 Tax=Brachybacterium sp. AOP25-B2-12 TaxID=3457710 RepID=UPI0040334CDE